MNKVFPFTKIKRDSDKCISCNICDKKCPMTIEVSKSKSISGSDCISCYGCIDSCPSKADALELSFFGKKVNPLIFGIVAIVFYYVLTYFLLGTH